VSEVWKNIWSLQVPGVLKLFIWKVCNNALPTKENMFSRKIVQDPLCPICEGQVETVWHALWDCPTSIRVWQECSQQIQKLSLKESG
jgi:hypothetical protein